MLPVEKPHMQGLVTMNFHKLIVSLMVVMIIGGCAPQNPMLSLDTESLIERALQLAEADELEQAIRVYELLIDRSTGNTRTTHLINGSQLLLLLHDHTTARIWLTRAQLTANSAQEQRVFLLLAEIDIYEGEPSEALETLKQVPQPYTDEVMTEIQAIRGRAFFGMGRMHEALSVLVQRESSLENYSQILENQRTIWAGLAEQTKQSGPEYTGDPLIDGWIQLYPIAFLSKENEFDLRDKLLDWRQSNLDHPAAKVLIVDLLVDPKSTNKYPEKIAILLPFNGAQRREARAIRDGFIAAHFENTELISNETSTSLKFYDTSTLGSEEAYFRAQIEGADFIVGPLLKSEVEEIINNVGLVPTLALNSIDNQNSSSQFVYQFSLAPEDEARAIAQHAINAGSSNAIAVVQNSDWGMRLLASFRDEFEKLGGEILQHKSYDNNSQDFSFDITTLLNIDKSNGRRQRLAANLGVPLEFEPRRRQDIDVIFVASDANAGRLLIPQLRFYYAGDIPTYTTSEVNQSNSRESDLNGVIFPDTPWILLENEANEKLKSSLETHWPQRSSPLWLRFYGFGFDAYRLVSLLHNQPEEVTSVNALSGELSLGIDGKISRLLPFAQYRDGMPLPLDEKTPLLP
ncbi:MAG: hypothetical protein CMM56_01610 [Rhodospirillaceae bacterium]|nr:hypothetical protein [Rhodospirillaceae bacterium]|tara:strand:+ start:497 stop:2389 length:1893 start_codon:yes stop_codon:yes gene_type:complete